MIGKLGKKGAYGGVGERELTPGLTFVRETLEGNFTKKGKKIDFFGTFIVEGFLAGNPDCRANFNVSLTKLN